MGRFLHKILCRISVHHYVRMSTEDGHGFRACEYCGHEDSDRSPFGAL